LEPLYNTNDEVAEEIIESTSLGDNPTVDFSTQPEEQNALNNFMAEQMETVPVEKSSEVFLESPLEPLTEKIELPEPIIDFPPEIEESGTISQEPPAALETEADISIPEIIEEQPSSLSEAPIITPIIPEAEPVSEMVEIPLEPLYAVDYFASQGIRLREEDQQDQLGKKLKSFTEWLKSMKKVHPEKSKGQMDEKTEAAIKSEAELSNDKADVLTETMAEVFIKQGLTQKAIDVYEKLSLLDPLKSATFAAKISELKAQ
jgi:hypothetical protein